MALIYFIIVQM